MFQSVNEKNLHIKKAIVGHFEELKDRFGKNFSEAQFMDTVSIQSKEQMVQF